MYKKIRNIIPILSSSNLIALQNIAEQTTQINRNYYQINVICCKRIHSLSSCLKGDRVLRETRNTNFKHQQVGQMSSTSNESILSNKYKPKECRFKNPYGYTAGLSWGRPDAPHKILCSHGWLDNAGSFERLIPFILDHGDNADNYHIVAMDHPGVGLSSHKPPGAEYTIFSTIIEMKRIMDQLQWSKATLISHSLGAHHSFMFSCIYPNLVESFVAIDLTQPMTAQLNFINANIVNAIGEHFKYEYSHQDDPTTNIRVPVYTEAEAIQRLMESHSNSLTKESAEVLLKRGAKKQSWGYTFSRDVRLRYTIGLGYTDEIMQQYLMEQFKPNLLLIRANSSPYQRSEKIRLEYYDIYRKKCPYFVVSNLDGTHHLHMNTPEPVAAEINKFLDEIRVTSQDKMTMNGRSNL